ncbi:MAG: sensor histidine kinase [Verrucomicrobia bacterium]|nr:sensor histidine kinase [Verrucomicrobiota bacterium]
MVVPNSLPHLLPWPLIIYSTTGIILYASHSFKNLFIKPPVEGDSLETIFTEFSPEFNLNGSGRIETKNGLLKSPEGYLDVVITSDDHYPKQFWLFVISNPDSSKNNALTESLQKAQLSLKQQSLFIANICHEIRNSLSIIQGLCEINFEAKTEEKDLTLQKVFHYSYELKNLVQDVLDFSSYEMGGIVLEKIPFDPVQVFEEIVTLNYPTTQRKNIELAALACPQSPRSVIGDSMKFRRLILNLLSNAIKFTEKGFVHCYLNFKDQGSHYLVNIIVHDSGIGIEPKQCSSIFEPFTQAEDSTARRFGGYGLGLSIVRDLVKAMDGYIEVNSEIGLGSKFIAAVKLDANPQYEFPHHIDLTGNKVLLIGGHADIQNWLIDYFTRGNAKVILAASNQEAEELWHQSIGKSDPFTQVIVDLPQDTAPNLTLIPLDKIILIADRDLHLRGIKQIPKPLTLSVLNHFFGQSLTQPHELNSMNKENDSKLKLKILLAEDNEVNREVTCRRLKSFGHEVTATVDGQAALELWRSKNFDLILVDLQMPLLDGLSLAKCIRQEEIKSQRRPTKLVALTGMNYSDMNSHELKQIGLDDYFQKPIRGADLINKINHLFITPDSPSPLDEFHTALIEADEEEIEDLKCAGRVFLRHSQSVIRQFEHVMQGTEAESIIKECHNLKGMLALMACPTLAHFAAELEQNPHGPRAKEYGEKLSDGLRRLEHSLNLSTVLVPHGQDKN